MTKKYYKFLILFTSLGFSMVSQSQSTKFQRLIGGSGNDRSYSMTQTKEGGYILTGYTSSFGSGGDDIYLTKTDGLGKVLWSKTYGTSANETGWKVKQTSDSGYIVVGTSSNKKGDGLFFKTDLNGNMKWGWVFNSDSADEIYNVIESRNNGAFYITGFTKTDSFGTDAFLAKYSSTGGFLWQRKFGAGRNEEAYALVEELNGNIGVVGVVVDDTITVGGKNGSAGDEDFFIARFTPNGNNIWLKNFGSNGKDQVWDVKYLKGEYIVTGWSDVSSLAGDILVALVDTNGNFVKAFTVGASGGSKAFSLVINPDESYTITGYVNTVTSGREAFYLNTTKGGFIGTFNLFGGSATDGHWPSEVVRTIDGGYTIFTSSNSFRTNNYELYMIRTDGGGASNCNVNSVSASNKTMSMNSGKFGAIRQGFNANGISLTTKTITGNRDSVLCCKLQAQVLAPTVRICKGDGIRIGKPAIPGYVYKWNAVGGSYTSTEASPLVTPSANTTYKLVVSSDDGKCAKDSATVILTIRNVLTNTNFIRDTFFCAGDSVRVKAKAGAIDYTWIGAKTNLKGQNVILFETDVIVLTYTDTTTCKYKDTMTVVKKNLPVFDLGKDTTICDNTKLTLMGPSNMKSYSWNSGQATTQNYSTNEQKTHSLNVVDKFGCKFSDSRTIFLNQSSTFTLGPDTAICKGINYTIFGPGFMTNFYWNGVSSFNANKVINTPGTYILEAQNSFGCKFSDTILINQKKDPTFSLGPDGGVCKSGGRKLIGPSGVSKYQWDDGSNASTYDVFFAGSYWLKVTGTNGCIFIDTIKLTLVNNPTPELGNDTTIFDCDSIYLDAGNYVSYKWNTGETTRILKVKKANLYEITVTDQNTCNGIDDKSVKTKPCDNAIGNRLKIPGLKILPNPAHNMIEIEWLANGKEASLQFFDLQGQLIYQQKAELGLTKYKIDVSKWTRGIYYLNISTDIISQAVKIILE